MSEVIKTPFGEISEEEFTELCNRLILKASDNGHKVAVLAITLDLEKYNKEHKGSCDFSVIPDLQDDEYIKSTLSDLVDYIRENYNCNKFVEV